MDFVNQPAMQDAISSAPALSHYIDNSLAEQALGLITSRQNITSKRLVEPGPSAKQVMQIFSAAAAAPDHGLLMPWRFIVVPENRRVDLAEVFALALIDRDPSATLVQIEDARDKAYRAPMLMLAVAKLGPCEPNMPTLERMVSVGAAIQNMLLIAHSMGYGSGLASGQAIQTQRMKMLFELGVGEEAVCFINIGTTSKPKLQRQRPEAAFFVSSL